MENRVGEVLASKYRLEALLGSGGMGHVYRAVNEHVGRAVAIKVLRAEHAQNAQVVERFLREARAANLVRHPNVVDVLDIGKEDDGAPFIVQELLDGEDLGHLVERRGGLLPVDEVLSILGPVIDAVAEAHRRGVVHRDIKPENVFLVRSPRGPIPKLLDFGISKITAPDLRATEVGVMMGTPAYMAPEQVQGARDADPRSDVWALGIMLFELITGHMPFDAQDAPQLFFAIATKDAPTLIAAGAIVPLEVSRLVERCLRRRPEDRYASAAEVARDLKRVLAGDTLDEAERRSVPPSFRETYTDLGLMPPAPRLPPDLLDGRGGTEPGYGSNPRAERAGARAISQPGDESLPKPPSLPPPTLRTGARPASARPPALRPAVPASIPPGPASGPPRSYRDRASGPPLADGSSGPPMSARTSALDPISGYPSRRDPSSPSQRSPRTAGGVSLSGVGLAPGSSSVKHANAHASWGARQQPERADLSPIVALGVVGLVAILGTGLLMRVVHRPEGWPVAQFAIDPSSGLATAIHALLAVCAFVIGITYSRRGVRHWRGDLVGGGPPGAIINALLASGAFFAAIELASAAY